MEDDGELRIERVRIVDQPGEWPGSDGRHNEAAHADGLLRCDFERNGATEPEVIEQKLTRTIALIGPVGERRAAQTSGFPLDPSKMLPVADVILLVVGKDEGAMIFRYTAHGEVAGDTLHPTSEDAIEQAVFEYGAALGEWLTVPDDIMDAHAFAVQYAHERLNGRGNW
jgi:hypothetical protein